jgi:hypothetical protein
MADTEKGVKIKIEGDAASLVAASGQGADALKKLVITTEGLSDETKKQLGIVEDSNDKWKSYTVTQADVEAATKKTTDATEASTEKFGQSRREIRLVGNELGRAVGISGVGGLFLGGVAASAFAAAKAIGFLKDTWVAIQAAIKGPINIDVKVDEAAPGKISAVAAAWETYAAAYQKVANAYNTPQAGAGREEKKLEHELKLIKEVLEAEEKKEMIEAGDNKAAQDAVRVKFGHAAEQADEAARQGRIKIKQKEASDLRADANDAADIAGAITTGEGGHSAELEKTAEKNAAAAEKAKDEIQANLELIARLKYSGESSIHGTDKEAGDVVEYEGFGGFVQKQQEGWAFKRKYGMTASIGDAVEIEKQRLAQANAIIGENATNKAKGARDQENKKRLLEEAGTKAGQADELDKDIAADQAAAAADAATAAQVAGIKSGAAAAGRTGAPKDVEDASAMAANVVAGKSTADQNAELIEIESRIAGHGVNLGTAVAMAQAAANNAAVFVGHVERLAAALEKFKPADLKTFEDRIKNIERQLAAGAILR